MMAERKGREANRVKETEIKDAAAASAAASAAELCLMTAMIEGVRL
jgi:hypothetical protein